jgi:indolepyruvate ferredoxin oxidoreductase beta subunit
MVDVYLAGVGGQGIITASRIIGDAAISAGLNVLLSETHGMAQRGGSVVCTARIGDVHSPLIPDGQADVILSFELLETWRALCNASHKTIVISSTERIAPLSVTTQKMTYPGLDEVKAEASKRARAFIEIDAAGIAREAGSPLSSNVVMVGALAGTGLSGIDGRHFEKAIEMDVPAKIEENVKAFRSGLDLVAARLDK